MLNIMSNTLYATLGVSKNANESEIKRAYRALSLKYHPDRNNTNEAENKIREINEAYDILGDSSKRKHYDMEQQMGGNLFDFQNTGVPPHMNDLFEMLFKIPTMNGSEMPEIHIFQDNMPGGGGGLFKNPMANPFMQFQKNVSSTPSTPSPIHIVLPITFMQAFQGSSLPVEIQREIYIGDVKIHEEETIYVTVPPGIDENEIITISGKGNVNSSNIKGDVKIAIKLIDDPIFTRKGLDLIFKKTISLKESLCGFSIDINHLNGKILSLNNQTNRAVVSPNFRKTVPNLGFERGPCKGSLIIEFDVKFPDRLSEEQIQVLDRVLHDS
jgi:DnaJ-class molecular chaperone